MLCVNMQTSFMHPPFGFALFYLRGISDTLHKNGALPARVESKDIYLGAVPFVLLQLVLVLVVIFVPQTVSVFLDQAPVIDLDKVELPPAESADPAEAADDNQAAIDQMLKDAAQAASAPR